MLLLGSCSSALYAAADAGAVTVGTLRNASVDNKDDVERSGGVLMAIDVIQHSTS
jgi:hypothetical protein